jgi:TolB-like protein/DNA-binding winged helix-turn-helix (wHTH) protein/tetratricopeptide (TPR) repeat protein
MSNADETQWCYRFGDFTLNTARGLLLKNAEEVKIRPQSLAVLRLLLENHGNLVIRDDLHAAVWGRKAVTDDSLAQCLTDIRRAIGDTDRKIIRTLPRRGYVFVADVDVEPAAAPPLAKSMQYRRSLAWWPAALFVAAAVWFGVTQLFDDSSPSANQPVGAASVAVLPFTNMSANTDDQYLADGMAETLLHNLAQVRELKVSARTSSFAFRDKNNDIREIGRALGVSHILEGSVQRSGDRIRITAQLNRTRDGLHVWSESYEREVSDIFAIQDEIAEQVGIKLLTSMLNPYAAVRRRGVGTESFAAYDLYLRARAEVRNGSLDAMRSAEGYLLAALQEDPNFLDAKTELAELMLWQADTGLRSYDDGIARLVALTDEVLAADPQHARAKSLHIFVPAMMAINNGDFAAWKRAEPEMRTVVAAAPDDVDAKIYLAQLISRFGNRAEGISIFRDVLETDPLNIYVYELLANAHTRMHDYESARDVLLRAVKIDPNAPNIWAKLGNSAVQLGDGVLAIESYLQSQASDVVDPELSGRTAEFLYQLGLPEEAGEIHEQVRRIAPDSEDAHNLELLRTLAFGDEDRAIEFAREIIRNGVPERYSAWPNAWKILLFTSVARGAAKEDIAFVDKYLPDFSNLDTVDVAWPINVMRGQSFDVLAAVKTTAELRRFSEDLTGYLQQLNMEADDYPTAYLGWQVFFGNTDVAMQFALDEVFSKPVIWMPMWRAYFSRPFMREFTSDPRIQAALQSWEYQETQIRADVRRYLAESDAIH